MQRMEDIEVEGYIINHISLSTALSFH